MTIPHADVYWLLLSFLASLPLQPISALPFASLLHKRGFVQARDECARKHIKTVYLYAFTFLIQGILPSYLNSCQIYSSYSSKLRRILLSATNLLIMVVPSTCCGRAGGQCICASQAKCSCGKQSALKCNCEKATTENKVEGARCSCR